MSLREAFPSDEAISKSWAFFVKREIAPGLDTPLRGHSTFAMTALKI
jgi:hypothetical protein